MIISTNGYVYFNQSTNSIEAQYADLTTESEGNIFYRFLDSSVDMMSIKADVGRLYDNYTPLKAFEITYDNVPAEWSSLKASFKIILSTDTIRSFVLLKYTSCLYNSQMSSKLIYLSKSKRLVELPIVSPCNSTNAKQLGTWIYEVSSYNNGLTFNFIFFKLPEWTW